LIPIITPELLPIVALLFERLQVPPVTVDDNVVSAPTHTAVLPVSAPADGTGSTNILAVSTSVPHTLVNVYNIVSRPVLTPVTMPEELTPAWVLVLLHKPPVSVSLSVITEPVQTLSAPDMDPLPTVGYTVMILSVTPVPQEPTTE
jgi:hypothetical protein